MVGGGRNRGARLLGFFFLQTQNDEHWLRKPFDLLGSPKQNKTSKTPEGRSATFRWGLFFPFLRGGFF